MTIYLQTGDCRAVLPTLPDASAHCCVTSPPYWSLRDYGHPDQLGLEPSPFDYIAHLVGIFDEVRRILTPDGTLWVVIGDAYAASGSGGSGHRRRITPFKRKDLMLLPARFAIAMQEAGWYVRSETIWHKPNPTPESCRDRPTQSHEKVYLFAKQRFYYYDHAAVMVPAKTLDDRRPYTPGQVDARGNGHDRRQHNDKRLTFDGRAALRNVWSVTTKPLREAHYAAFPPDLIEPCIKASCPKGGMVLDPFAGTGTTGLVAQRLQRNAHLIECNPAYVEIAGRRIASEGGMFTELHYLEPTTHERTAGNHDD